MFFYRESLKFGCVDESFGAMVHFFMQSRFLLCDDLCLSICIYLSLRIMLCVSEVAFASDLSKEVNWQSLHCVSLVLHVTDFRLNMNVA